MASVEFVNNAETLAVPQSPQKCKEAPLIAHSPAGKVREAARGNFQHNRQAFTPAAVGLESSRGARQRPDGGKRPA